MGAAICAVCGRCTVVGADVEEIAGELYGLKPAEFLAARDAYVAEARKAEDAAGEVVVEAGTAVSAAEHALREARRVAGRAARAVQRLEQQAEP